MKKILTLILATLLATSAYTHAPSVISYEASVMSRTGLALAHRNVAFRIAILNGSASGTIAYQERQVKTTDLYGTVSLAIGRGSVLSGSFSTIDWGKGNFYLRTEVDTNGGTNYLEMGASQLLSVPYSFYSNKTDQTNLASPYFPDGLDNAIPVMLNGIFTYTVPAGKTLYITQIGKNSTSSCPSYSLYINGSKVVSANSSNHSVSTNPLSLNQGSSGHSHSLDNDEMITVPEGKTISSDQCGTSLRGVVTGKNHTWVLTNLKNGSYTVPMGKVLVITNMMPADSSNTWNGYFKIGACVTSFSGKLTFADQGEAVAASTLSAPLFMTGYLINK